MTSQGEPDQSAAGQEGGTPAADRRGRRFGRRRTALWCALVVAAAAVGFVVSLPHPGDLIPGLGSTAGGPKAQPAPGLDSQQPLTEAQVFTADHYFPGDRTVDQDGVQARRTAAAGGGDCAETLLDRAHDPLHDTGCQAYVGVAFDHVDQKVVSSVTVFRFADEEGARKARQALTDPGALLFRTSAPATPSPTTGSTASPGAGTASASPGAPAGTAPSTQTAATAQPGASATQPAPKPVTAVRVEPVGRYLTVTVSRYADGRTTTPPDDRTLDHAARALSYVVRAPFLWM
ncbi:hypothetical protein [Kitasatospora sp. NBC_01539]|uniref:hypothetical protein n=1 Tax=Kitasatospora sp. NBC_01539 TaxID=2903577 RepID=UPI0038601237